MVEESRGLKAQIEEVGREPDELRRKLKFLGILYELLEPEGVAPVLVGGTALEFYTFGSYTTSDVDLVAKRRDRVAEALSAIGM